MSTKTDVKKNGKDDKCVKKQERPLTAPIRVMDEYRALKDMANDSKTFRDFKFTCENMLKWNALILPQKEPYKEKAWRIEIELSRNYPQSPPKVRFETPIYHPNISAESGEIRLEILEKKQWKGNIRMNEVINAIIDLIENPNAENEKLILNQDAAKEIKDNDDDFRKKAEEKAKKQGLKRPPEPESRRKNKKKKRNENQSA